MTADIPWESLPQTGAGKCRFVTLIAFYCAGHLAQAVKGLNPKINIWTTGNGEGPSADSMAPLRNLFTTLPPLVSSPQQ